MSQRLPANPLHLQDLVITGFRGIRDLSIGRLGRVTLLAGRNGVGKTTVLEAVRVFASRGHDSVLSGVLQERDELVTADDDDEKMLMPDFTALFHERNADGGCIAVGPSDATEHVVIQETALPQDLAVLVDKLVPDSALDGQIHGLRAMFRGVPRFLPVVSFVREPNARRTYARATHHTARILRRAFDEGNRSPAITFLSVGPAVLTNDEIARYWDAIALTPHEAVAEEALRLVMGDRVQRVAVIGDDSRLRRRRRAIVKLKGLSYPVPLRSLGDGAVRVLGVALALANCGNGFLLLDEVENGIHHSLQKAFWRMVLKTAHANNVQVLATTHSFDCVKGFAEASGETDEVESALARVVRRDGETGAVEYPEKHLRIAAEQGIEVR